jgi:hypothetical protein
MGTAILALVLGTAFIYVFFWPLSREEKEMPDIIEEYKTEYDNTADPKGMPL